jgi:hypothetical protein
MEYAALTFLHRFISQQLVEVRNYETLLRPLYVKSTEILLSTIRDDLKRYRPDKQRHDPEEVKALARVMYRNYMRDLRDRLEPLNKRK